MTPIQIKEFRLNLEEVNDGTYLTFALHVPSPAINTLKRAKLFADRKQLTVAVLAVTKKHFDPAIPYRLTKSQLTELGCDLTDFS